jgi:hypothetical protein
MEEIGCLPALSAKQQNPSTLATFSNLETIEQHVGSALDGIKIDLLF